MKRRNWTRYCTVALRLSTNYWMPRDAWTILATLKDKVARKSQKSKSQLLLHSGFFGRISARTCLFQYIYSFCSSPNQLTLRMTCTCLHLRRCIRHTTLGAPVLQARSSENRETARKILVLWRPNAKLPGKHPKKTQIYKHVFVSFSFHSLHIRIWRFLQLQWFPRHETDEAVEGAHVTTIKTPAAEHPVDAFKRATCDNRLWKRKKNARNPRKYFEDIMGIQIPSKTLTKSISRYHTCWSFEMVQLVWNTLHQQPADHDQRVGTAKATNQDDHQIITSKHCKIGIF